MNEEDANVLYEAFLVLTEKLVGDAETSLDTIAKAGKFLFENKFTGVYASDKVPPTLTYAIINLDKSTERGSHWVALARQQPGLYLLYDSFGRSKAKILPDLKMLTKDTDHDAEQEKSEDNCGARCLAWLCVFDQVGKEAASLV